MLVTEEGSWILIPPQYGSESTTESDFSPNNWIIIRYPTWAEHCMPGLSDSNGNLQTTTPLGHQFPNSPDCYGCTTATVGGSIWKASSRLFQLKNLNNLGLSIFLLKVRPPLHLHRPLVVYTRMLKASGWVLLHAPAIQNLNWIPLE